MSPLAAYTYSLPPELIAHTPAEPRESARLFVYDTARDTVTFATVADLSSYIAGSHLVYNDTTVLPARLFATHSDGLAMELLILVDRGIRDNGEVHAILNRKKLKVGEKIFVADSYFTVLDTRDKGILLRYEAGKEARTPVASW
jgi:S-adenosylmethionine:tRNA ribosyltransferase-isomerase